MDTNPPKLDVSAHDPVEVLMIVARNADVDVPAGAREWLSAQGPAPDAADAAVYAELVAELRRAQLPAVARTALDDALEAARDDRRLAHLLGQATAPEGSADRGESADGASRGGPEPRQAETAEVDDDGWFEPPDDDDDPIAAFLAVAERAGVPIPAGAAAWLSATGPAPVGEAWPYRTMITALAVAPLPVELRAAADRAQARARAVPCRLAELLGTTRQAEPTPAPTSRAVAQAQSHRRRWSQLRPGADGLHRQPDARRDGQTRRQRPRRQRRWPLPRWQRPRPARTYRMVVLLAVLLAVGAGIGAAVARVAPEARELVARFTSSSAAHTSSGPTEPRGEVPTPEDGAQDVGTRGSHEDAAALVDAALRRRPGRPGVAAEHTLVDAETGRTATVTTIAVREVVVDGAWVPADDVAGQLTGVGGVGDDRTRPWTPVPADVAPAPGGETFLLDGPVEATPVVRHGQVELAAGGGGTQRWLLVPSPAGAVAVVLTVPDGALSPEALRAADEQWLAAASRVLTRFGGADRDDVVGWVAETLGTGR